MLQELGVLGFQELTLQYLFKIATRSKDDPGAF
jgi:hypothetical protein